MDLITVDVTDLPEVPAALSVLGPRQGIDALAEQAGTIGYEILTSLGARYARRHLGGG
jgi:alanine racemase